MHFCTFGKIEMMNVATTDILVNVFKYPFSQLVLFLQLVTKYFRCQLLLNVDVTVSPMLHWVHNAEM